MAHTLARLTLQYGRPLLVVFIILLLVCCFVLVDEEAGPPLARLLCAAPVDPSSSIFVRQRDD